MNSWRKTLAATLAIAITVTFAGRALAQDSNLKVTGSLPANPLPPPATSGPIQLQHTLPVSPQEQPDVSVPNSDADQFQHGAAPVISIPQIIGHQWNLSKQVPPENLISERYIRSLDTEARGITLKEAIYIALKNNPALQSAQLDPVASLETVRQANGTFDPNLTAQGDVIKSTSPTTSILSSRGDSFTQKFYDWNFGLNKVSAITNGTWGITFDNDRSLSNNAFSSVNPSYTPSLTMSLSQPLLQNFGWQFATINVRIAESGQKVAQWNYGQTLQDFVEKIGAEYWQVVLSEENLQVARAALRFNEDLVRQNAISVKVGTLAPIDLQEAQSASATAEANVYTAEANLRNARIQLREDVMLNPYGTFIPEDLEPITRPNPQEQMAADEERSLELAVQYRPSLGSLRESIRNALLQVKFSENQTLPSLNLGTQFGITSTAGTTPCLTFGSLIPASESNCSVTNPTPPPTTLSGAKLPFGGIYGDALNRLGSFAFYNYAAVLTFQLPLANAVARSALAQARVLYEQQRLNYRSALAQTVVDVQSGLANLYADQKRAAATAQATYYARQSLHDEEVRFRVGLATTHDLLQFQEEEVSAEGQQVQAEIDLENAKLAYYHAEGVLLRQFQISWQVVNPHEMPWYAAF